MPRTIPFYAVVIGATFTWNGLTWRKLTRFHARPEPRPTWLRCGDRPIPSLDLVTLER